MVLAARVAEVVAVVAALAEEEWVDATHADKDKNKNKEI